MSSGIVYTAGYRYQLENQASWMTPILGKRGGNRFVQINDIGLLVIQPGYAWNGASGPMPDIPTVMRGAMFHDGLYQLTRIGVLSLDDRRAADQVLYDICRDSGMNSILAGVVYRAVRMFGGLYIGAKDQTFLSAP